jgi:hypothetical protein
VGGVGRIAITPKAGRVYLGVPAGTGSPLRRHPAPAAKIAAVKTRTLLILAAVTGVLIVAAGALQIMLAR